ncbi:MAG: hypothetical protein B7Y61_07910 [Rhizobiales bacterium 35-66-30]|nr:MAG: hypothetical protein B7Y61_07910 [Rhizobiales bacterium 35-66-30]OZB02440.1 MAG: hypothetical protein B7X67_20085 [Rhizobiales bacterium 39-66-18]
MDAQEHSNSTRPAISPLRQRMIEDMTIRRFGKHTQRDYVRQIAEFTAFLCRPPDQAEPEDLRRYQIHLASVGASYARMNLACTALRFFSTSRWGTGRLRRSDGTHPEPRAPARGAQHRGGGAASGPCANGPRPLTTSPATIPVAPARYTSPRGQSDIRASSPNRSGRRGPGKPASGGRSAPLSSTTSDSSNRPSSRLVRCGQLDQRSGTAGGEPHPGRPQGGPSALHPGRTRQRQTPHMPSHSLGQRSSRP